MIGDDGDDGMWTGEVEDGDGWILLSFVQIAMGNSRINSRTNANLETESLNLETKNQKPETRTKLASLIYKPKASYI